MKINSDKSLLRNLLYSLILFGRIKTTRTRAKASSGIADKLVNKIKKGTTSARRGVLKFLTEKEVVKKLEKEIVPKLKKRQSGYTRTTKVGTRVGDRAAMVLMEWVFDEEENEPNLTNETNEKKETAASALPKKQAPASQSKNDKTDKNK